MKKLGWLAMEKIDTDHRQRIEKFRLNQLTINLTMKARALRN